MHELEKYWTLSKLSGELGISIQRLGRLLKIKKIETYRIGAAVMTHQKHLDTLRKSLQKNGR